ncbi:MAG: 23S rRNA (cytosine(1962)-C(5))-methyltransferase RlmI [Anaerolineae bacterium]|nr:23S rRNA (cytosine(1962)-C(5))-methyltransferase RlmI [Anaerolineae bacterium]
MPEPRVVLRPERERSVLNRHPWLFSGAIAQADCPDGQVAEVFAADGRWLARGYYNSRSQIRVRLLTWDPEEAVDREFWRGRLIRALEGRRRLPGWPSTAARLVNAEADGLPGLVADLYVEAEKPGPAVLVFQALTLGIEVRREELLSLLEEVVTPEALPGQGTWRRLALYDRSDADVRRLEGLPSRVGPIAGEEPRPVAIREGGLLFEVDVRTGHKTGFYLDQSANRVRVSRYCAGADVLNAFAYTGGFGVHALGAGAATVVDVDTSAAALEAGRGNVERNRLPIERRVEVEGDVFGVLRRFRDAGRLFDVVVLDPPRFAQSARQVQAACRGYKDINLLGLGLLRPGGVLATFSCSGLVSADLFQKVVFGAAVDARREVQVLETLSQAPDHPISITFPESRYLKGLLCRVW